MNLRAGFFTITIRMSKEVFSKGSMAFAQKGKDGHLQQILFCISGDFGNHSICEFNVMIFIKDKDPVVSEIGNGLKRP